MFDFLLALLLIWYDRKERKDGRLFSLYLILYSLGRFGIEFIRGDPRVSVGTFSTSGINSIFIAIIDVGIYNYDKIKQYFTKGKNKQI